MFVDIFVTNILCRLSTVAQYKYQLNSQAQTMAVAGLSLVILAQVVVAFK